MERLASSQHSSAAGSAAGLVLALAAALMCLAASLSPDRWDRSGEAAERARKIMDSALDLAEADAAAYEKVLRLRRALPSPERAEAVASALSGAAEVPLQMAELAAELAGLGLAATRYGNPNLRGDAATAALLAAATARSCALLVEIDLASSAADPRIALAHGLAARAEAAARDAIKEAAVTDVEDSRDNSSVH